MSASYVAHNLQEKTRTGDVLISENVDFEGLLLSDPILKGLKSAGFERPSPIQLKAIPLGRCGLDLIVQAKSGTGKTCVFSVIALENLQLESTALQVIVLAPTREIAIQIWDVINSIGKATPSLKCHTFIGGMPLQEDRQKLKKCHIGVGTPGRIKQLLEMGIMNVESVRMFILDEADKLLEESFQEQINWIYSVLPNNKQMLALSATYPEYLAQHLTAYMRNPTFLRLNISDPALLGIKQYFKTVPYHPLPTKLFEGKVEVVVKLLSSVNFQQCLIFSNLQTRAQNMADTLTSMGWPTAYIAGSHDQKDRNEAMAKLKTYKCRVLISTDLTSRGIDADKVNMVINLDVPKDHETYLHRIGRAGRFGSFGAAITIVSIGQEQTDLQAVEKKCNTHINPLPGTIPADLCKNDVQIHLDDVVSSEQIITDNISQHRLENLKNGRIEDSVEKSNHSAEENISGNSLSSTQEHNIHTNGTRTQQTNCTQPQYNAVKNQMKETEIGFSEFGVEKQIDNETNLESINNNNLENLDYGAENKTNLLVSVHECHEEDKDPKLHPHVVCVSNLSNNSTERGESIKKTDNFNSSLNDEKSTSNKIKLGQKEYMSNFKVQALLHHNIPSEKNQHPSFINTTVESTSKSTDFKIPSYEETIGYQKLQKPHTYELAVLEFKEIKAKSNSSSYLDRKFPLPRIPNRNIDISQRKELLNQISTFLKYRFSVEDSKFNRSENKNLTEIESAKVFGDVENKFVTGQKDGPGKSNGRKHYRPFSLGAFCNDMRQNHSDSHSENNSEKIPQNEQNIKEVISSKNDDGDNVVKQQSDNSDYPSVASSSASSSDIDDSSESIRSLDEDIEGELNEDAEGELNNEHLEEPQGLFKNMRYHDNLHASSSNNPWGQNRPNYLFQNPYWPWYNHGYIHTGHPPWHSYSVPWSFPYQTQWCYPYQSLFGMPQRSNSNQMTRKLQENLEIQYEYIKLMLQKK